MHFNLREERCRAHFSKYCKTYFPTTEINGFTYIMSEEAVLRFPSFIQLFATFSEIPTEEFLC